MAIDPSLLVSAAILQDYFVDKTTGAPLSGGMVTFYQDNSRTTLKNVYYQSGSPLGYTYIPLPNPLTLSDVGTIEDANGNDTIPFFYPYSELDNTTKQPYYITVYSSDGILQFTRQNFPFNPGTQTGNVNATNENLIANNEFWRNIGSLNATTLTNSFTLNGGTLYYATIAPSQHDGFTDQSDIQFIKDVNGATDTLTFSKFVGNFPDQTIPDDITPEYYLNINCSGAGSETVKYVQVPIQLHVDSLSGVLTCTAVIDAMAVTGDPKITIGLFQFLGTGVTSPILPPIETITLSPNWSKYTVTFNMPTAQGLTLGNGGDDALYFQIGLPVASTFNINIAKPAVYLADQAPTNDWQTYDEINSIISSPRTGDIRTSLNAFYPYGWVPMNGGTIGNTSSNATARANTDTWPLFELLWNAFHAYTSGSTNLLAQMVTSAGSNVAYGGTAIADFTANNAITLTKTMGQVILGTVPVNALITTYKTTFVSSNIGGNLALSAAFNMNLFNGMPIIFTNDSGPIPSTLSLNTVYYVAAFNGANIFYVATTFANAIAANQTLTGNVITYAAGTGTVISALAGSYEGEYAHMQLLNELKNHTHNIGYFANVVGGPLNNSNGTVGNPGTVTGNVTGEGTQVGFNVTQPGTFYNIYMKL